MKLSSKKGFSLVELIIVIAILGIIAVIAVPNLTGIQQRSQVNADIRTAEQIGKAVRIYLTDTGAGTRSVGTTWKKYSEITGINSYIPTSYAPKSVTTNDGSYWVKEFTPSSAAEGETRIAVGIGKEAPSSNTPYTAGTSGVAYVEGASDLTTGVSLMGS